MSSPNHKRSARRKSRSAETSDVDDGGFIYTPTIRLKNGRILIAAHYGLKAFKFKAKENRPPAND